MNWKIKSALFWLFEKMPFGHFAYSVGQRFLTGRYIPKVTAKSLKTYMIPVNEFMKIEGAQVAMEFGAGRGLITPLLLSAAGAKAVHAYDLSRLATIEQINAVIEQLGTLRPGLWERVKDFAELESRYRIFYHAPGDARRTGQPDGSVDLIYSSATLEHIPPEQIRAILKELKRILSSHGKFCFTIDYHDHYASFDKNIGYMNFYQYSEDQWATFNPDMHYQNRLRHSDYVELFADEGLTAFKKTRIFDSWAETDLGRVQLHEAFRHYAHEDLTASNGYFVLGHSAEPTQNTVTAS